MKFQFIFPSNKYYVELFEEYVCKTERGDDLPSVMHIQEVDQPRQHKKGHVIGISD